MNKNYLYYLTKIIMKKNLLYTSLFIVFLALKAYSNTSLTITNPRGWGVYNGEIHNVEVKLTPKGSYMQYDLTMSIHLAADIIGNTDTLEAIMYFDLPKNCIINDSWLWIDDYISKAKLIEVNTAINIYDGIVRRRRDPSLLTKNFTQYKMSIFPILSSLPRKIKISYLVPMEWNKNDIAVDLPIQLFNTSYNIRPNISLAVKNDAYFNNYEIAELTTQPSIDSSVSGYTYYTILNTQYTSFIKMNVIAHKPTSENLNSYFYENSNSGYFESIIDMQSIISSTPKKICIAIENDISSPSVFTNTIEYIAFIRKYLLQYYTEKDSFMLVYLGNSTTTPINLVSTWKPINSTYLDANFNSSIANNIINSQFATKELLVLANNNILNNNTGGEVVLFTNIKRKYNWPDMYNYIDAIKSQIDSTIKINVLNFYGKNTNSNIDDVSNSYIFKKLCNYTNGIYNDYETADAILQVSTNYYYNNSFTILPNKIIKKEFEDMSPNIPFYSFNYSIAGGIIADKYESFYNQPLREKSEVRVSGKFFGTNPIQVTYSMNTDSGIYSKNLISYAYYSDSTIRQNHFANKYLIPADFSTSNVLTTNELIDLSINQRVLSNKTAFLALETTDTMNQCISCLSSPTQPSALTTNRTLSNEIFPNPFINNLTIRSSEKIDRISMCDIYGKLVLDIDLATNLSPNEWQIDPTNSIAPGIYFITIYSGINKEIIKVIKQ